MDANQARRLKFLKHCLWIASVDLELALWTARAYEQHPDTTLGGLYDRLKQITDKRIEQAQQEGKNHDF